VAAPGDHADSLTDVVRHAHEQATPLRIIGSGSKAALTGERFDVPGAPPPRWLSVGEHRGIVDYRPEELVITARAGTPLEEIERQLAEHGQMLPFEPPRFRGGGTLGGAVASGLSGPGRPWRGAVRDNVLGVELINGRGERLRFGGQVMKNVAGYDLSRLQAGAFGTLGLLLAVSVKLLPCPQAECSLCFELDDHDALSRCRTWARQPWPISGACLNGGRLTIRLSGAASAVASAARVLGGERTNDPGWWAALRDGRHPFFAAAPAGSVLWRCVLPPAADLPLQGCLVNWAGAERWCWREQGDCSLVTAANAAGGHARPFDGMFGRRDGAHLAEAERRIAARLRAAFDPHGIFNRHLTMPVEAMYAD
jgi:glycolate oxidase FAD binding subunit